MRDFADVVVEPELVEIILDDQEKIDQQRADLTAMLDEKLKEGDLTQPEYDAQMVEVNKLKSVQETYGDTFRFWTFDRVSLDQLAKLAGGMDIKSNIELMKKLVLDSNGKPLITGKKVPPTGLITLVSEGITDKLGKL